IAAAGL
ncbi:hypothetical protein MKD33_16500, partial [Chromobacterium piscinae]